MREPDMLLDPDFADGYKTNGTIFLDEDGSVISYSGVERGQVTTDSRAVHTALRLRAAADAFRQMTERSR